MSTQTDRPRDSLAALKIDRRQPVRRSGNGRLSKFLVGLMLALVLGGGGFALSMWAGWFDDPSSVLAVPDMIRSRPEVRTAQVEVQRGRSSDATVVATGYLESRWQANIGARAPGRVETINVEEGSVVTKDQVLAVLEHADLDAALGAAEASLARAKAALVEHEILVDNYRRDFARAERLHKSSSISEVDFDRSRFQYQSAVARIDSLKAEIALAESRVQEARQLRENMYVRAPFDGTVISKDAELGESILPGGMGEASGRGSVVTIADLTHLEVDCDVKEDFINRVREGQMAEVAVDAVPDRRYPGRVRKIIPMGDRARATIKVKVEITEPDAKLFPDMSARVFFLPESAQQTAEDQRRVFCPVNAVVTEGGGEAEQKLVWVVDAENRVHRRVVKVGMERDNQLEITDGLEGHERIVLEPKDLQEGRLVKVAQQ